MFKEEYNIDFRKAGQHQQTLVSSIYVDGSDDSHMALNIFREA